MEIFICWSVWVKSCYDMIFFINYHPSAMMKKFYTVYHYIDPFVHQYWVTTFCLHADDLDRRPFAYSFNMFICCYNPRQTTASSVLTFSITSSSIASISFFYNFLITFSPILSFSSASQIYFPDPNFHVLPFNYFPPQNIILLSFDSITNSLVSLFLHRPYCTLNPFLCESNFLYFHLTKFYISLRFRFFFKILVHNLPSLQHQLSS